MSPLLVAQRVVRDLPLGAHAPKHEGDCGWDLEAMEDVVIKPGHMADVPINCRLWLPPGYWGQILARSSINRLDLHVECGIIDNGYRGPIFVVLRNMARPSYVVRVDGPAGSGATEHAYAETGVNDVTVMAGERVGQLVLHRLAPADLVEGEVPTDTARGVAGFGSTGA